MAESVKKRPGALWATDADIEKPRLSMGTALGIAAVLVVLIGFALSQIDLDKAMEEAKKITRAVIIEDKPPPPPPPPPPKPPEPEKVQKIVKRNIPVDTPPPPVPVPDSPPPAIPVAENPSPTAPAIGTPGASGPAVAAPAPAPAQTGPVAVGMACPNQPRPEVPPRVLRSGNFTEATIRIHARIKGGQVTDVEVVSYSGQSEFRQDFRRVVESIVKRYTCENNAQEVVAEQEFAFRSN
ncbi:hypothetical protein BH09PSE6_BH09PSE6_22500 [soil metagenome]